VALARTRERAQPIEEPLHPPDLARDDPAEVVDEPVVAATARQELGERLHRDQRVLDLVGDADASISKYSSRSARRRSTSSS